MLHVWMPLSLSVGSKKQAQTIASHNTHDRIIQNVEVTNISRRCSTRTPHSQYVIHKLHTHKNTVSIEYCIRNIHTHTTDAESAESQFNIVIPYQKLVRSIPIITLHIDYTSNTCWKYDELYATRWFCIEDVFGIRGVVPLHTDSISKTWLEYNESYIYILMMHQRPAWNRTTHNSTYRFWIKDVVGI